MVSTGSEVLEIPSVASPWPLRFLPGLFPLSPRMGTRGSPHLASALAVVAQDGTLSSLACLSLLWFCYAPSCPVKLAWERKHVCFRRGYCQWLTLFPHGFELAFKLPTRLGAPHFVTLNVLEIGVFFAFKVIHLGLFYLYCL